MKATVKRSNPEALERVKNRMASLRKMEIAVGFPRGHQKNYPDGTPVLDVAASHVFGESVPQRDFMALAKPKIVEDANPLLKQVTRETSAEKIMALENGIGQLGQAAIQEAIVNGNWPTNSDKPMPDWLRERLSKSLGEDIPEGMSYREAKMQFKGSDKPLIFDGHMLGAVTYVVRDIEE